MYNENVETGDYAMKKIISLLLTVLLLCDSFLYANMLKAEEIAEDTNILTEEDVQTVGLSADLEEGEAFVGAEDTAGSNGSSSAEDVSDENNDGQQTDTYRVSFEGSDHEDLLNAYINQQLYDGLVSADEKVENLFGQYEILGKKYTGDKLTDAERVIYEVLSDQICKTAAGEISSTEYKVYREITLSREELGVEKIIDSGSVSDEAYEMLKEYVKYDISKIMDILLLDHPYELYWFDKTNGMMMSDSWNIMYYTADQITFYVNYGVSMCVCAEYQGEDMFSVDTSIGQTIRNSIGNARSIVDKYAGYETDYEILRAYKNEICSLTSYNNDAAAGGMAYGNPWQLIWVFDKDPKTNVVCEGYSKAFQYLCDMTDFHNDDVCAYTVYGYAFGGNHMWNIVRMDDYKKYLVDVTNCDSGTIGAVDKLFLAGHDSSDSSSGIENGFVIKVGSNKVRFTYDPEVREVYSDNELSIAAAKYSGPSSQSATDGHAYASLDKKGRLTFFRSREQYVNDTYYPAAVDLWDEEFSGTIYTIDEDESVSLPAWDDARGSITAVFTAKDTIIAPETMNAWFKGCDRMVYADLKGFDTSSIDDLSDLFSDCSELEELDLSSFDTSAVTDMSGMFDGCGKLGTIILGENWTKWIGDSQLPQGDWSNGTLLLNEMELYERYPENSNEWAGRWHKIVLIDSIRLDREELRLMQGGSVKLNVSIKPKNADPGKIVWSSSDEDIAVVDQEGRIKALKEGRTTIEVTATDGSDVFAQCTVEVVPIEGKAYAVLEDNGDLVFFRSDAVYELGDDPIYIPDIEGNYHYGIAFELEKSPEEDAGEIPWKSYAGQIRNVYVAKGQVIQPNSMENWFDSCMNMVSFDGDGFDTSNVTSMRSLFGTCVCLRTLDISSFDTGNVTDMSGMFNGCFVLNDLDLSSLNTSSVTDMSYMFSCMDRIKTLDLGSFDTSSVNDLSGMFFECFNLQTVDLSSFDTSKVMRMKDMFANCAGLTKIILGEKFENWFDDAYLPAGLWYNPRLDIGKSEIELYEEYPENAQEWAGEWEKYCSITYVPGFEDVDNSMNPKGFEPGTNVELYDLSKEGYRFEGWYLDEALTKKISGITVGMDENITLYAKWEPIRYLICFDANLEDGKTFSKEYFYDQKENLPKDIFVYARMRLIEWNTRPDGTGEVFTDGQEILNLSSVDGDIITLYAVWDYKYETDLPYTDVLSGETEMGTRVSLFCDTPDSSIYYTVDGSDPKEEGNPGVFLYEDAFIIDEDKTIRAFARSAGFNDSDVITLEYTVKKEDVYGDICETDLAEAGIASFEDIPQGFWASKLHDFIYDPAVKSYVYEDVRVYHGNKLLVLSQDYTLKYARNTKAGTASLTVTGKGNYTGTLTKDFEIRPLSLSEDDVMMILNKDVFLYNGKTQRPTLSLEYKGIKLKNKTDYILSYEDPSSKGEASQKKEYGLFIELTGNYEGTLSSSYVILPKQGQLKPLSSLKLSSLKTQTYEEGKIFEPVLVLKDGNYELVKEEDYTLTYKGNDRAGTAYAVAEGKGNYTGTLVKPFKIAPIGLSAKNVTISGMIGEMTYDGLEKQQSLTLVHNGKTLIQDADYTLSYKNNIKAGTAAVTVKGINNYKGSFNKTFRITKVSLKEDMFALEESYPYEKGGVKPLPSSDLVLNSDYTLAYKNNTRPGTGTLTIKGKGNYEGSLTYAFAIDKKDLSFIDIQTADKTYTGKTNVWKSVPVLIDGNGKKLVSGTDYEKAILYTYVYDTLVTDSSTKDEVLKEAGEEVGRNDIPPVHTLIKATVFGKGNYEGSVSSSYRIVQADISKASVSIPVKYYTGRPVYLSKADITVKLNKQILSSSDYDIVGYTGNTYKGTAKVTLRGKGNYGGYKTVSFKIVQKSLGITIRFHGNGNTSGSMKDQIIYKDTKLIKNTYKRAAHGENDVFLGWSVYPGGEIRYKNNEIYPYDGDAAGLTFDLYAVWRSDRYASELMKVVLLVPSASADGFPKQAKRAMDDIFYEDNNISSDMCECDPLFEYEPRTWASWFDFACRKNEYQLIVSGSPQVDEFLFEACKKYPDRVFVNCYCGSVPEDGVPSNCYCLKYREMKDQDFYDAVTYAVYQAVGGGLKQKLGTVEVWEDIKLNKK